MDAPWFQNSRWAGPVLERRVFICWIRACWRIRRDRSRLGALLESFVVSELFKLASWSEEQVQLHVFRDKEQRELDMVHEAGDGRLVGVEVKAKPSLQPTHLGGLCRFAALAGERFHAGITLYDGEQSLRMGSGLWAVPLATLWRA